MSVSLFPHSLLSLPDAFINKAAMGAGIEVSQQHGLPLTKVSLVTSTMESLAANSKDQHQLETWYHFSGHLASG